MKWSVPKKLENQTGAASIVVVLLVGLAVTASTAGVMLSVRNTQQVNSATNAVSHAQNGAWFGAAAFQQYLMTVESADLSLLPQRLDVTADPLLGQISAENISSQFDGTDGSVTVDIVNVHAAAKSAYSLRMVFNVTPASDAGSIATPPLAAALGFGDGLSVSGGVEFVNGSEVADIGVDGDVIIDNTGLQDLGTISATGVVELGSNVAAENIIANGDVLLNNNTVGTVRTMGKVTAKGSSSVGTVWANDDVLIQASGRFETVNSVRNIEVASAGGAGIGSLNAGLDISVKAGPIEHLRAIGDIDISQWTTIETAVSMADITCVSPYWSNFNSIRANGNAIDCMSGTTVQSGTSETVAVMEPVDEYDPPEFVIDVWSVVADANYYIEWDDNVNRAKVIVNNVNGLTDAAEYYLADYPNNGGTPPYYDYLCESVASNGHCNVPAVPTAPICIGYSAWNRCISYNQSTQTWTINPSQTAPGVLFFDGNVILGNQEAVSTVLASGDIGTQGGLVVTGVNYAGYDRVCETDGSHVSGGVQSRFVTAFTTHYPINFCDVGTRTFTSLPVGNIGLAAGGYDPRHSAEIFEGGNIVLGSSTEISGAVLAGNTIVTGGSTTINGLVTAAGGANGTDGENAFGGRTQIDLSSSETYNPFDIPEIAAAQPEIEDTEDTFTPIVSDVVVSWVRPL